VQNTDMLNERAERVMRLMEAMPTQAYWTLAMASVVVSALLFLTGRRNSALFVGQWPPTFLGLALLYKLLRPSEERSAEGLQDSAQDMRAAMG